MQEQQNKLIQGLFKPNRKVQKLLLKIDNDQQEITKLFQQKIQDNQDSSLLYNISEIEPRQQREKFQLQLPMDRYMRKVIKNKNCSNTRYGSRFQVDCGDWGLEKKTTVSINGRDTVRIRNLPNSYTSRQQSQTRSFKFGQRSSLKESAISHEKQAMNSFMKDSEEQSIKFFSKIKQVKSISEKLKDKLKNKQKKLQPISKSNSSITSKFSSNLADKLDYIYAKDHNIFGNTKCKLLIINPIHIINTYFNDDQVPNNQWSANEIFYFFSSILKNYGIYPIQKPMIKKYRNCLYFGEKINPHIRENTSGFIWYYNKGLFYGTLQNSKKHGDGIEIDISKDSKIWRGKFNNGSKTGFFQIITSDSKYIGMIKNGYYEGEGVLTKKQSTYRGKFKAGLKSGRGQQIINETKTKPKIIYRGQFNQDRFEGYGELQKPTQNYYYKGKFKDGMINGLGYERTKIYEYSGQFINGKKNGKGVLKKNGGSVQQGIFKDDKFIKAIQNPENVKQINKVKTPKYVYNNSQKFEQDKILKHNIRQSQIRAINQKYLSFELQALSEENQQNICTINVQQKVFKSQKSIQKQTNQLTKLLNNQDTCLEIPFDNRYEQI